MAAVITKERRTKNAETLWTIASSISVMKVEFAADLKYSLWAQGWQPRNRRTDSGKALQHGVHPRERVDDHKVNEATSEHVLDETAEEVRRVKLSLGKELDPSDKDVDQRRAKKSFSAYGWIAVL